MCPRCNTFPGVDCDTGQNAIVILVELACRLHQMGFLSLAQSQENMFDEFDAFDVEFSKGNAS